MYGDTSYQWRLEEQVAARVQGAVERISDFLVCLQGLYLKFLRLVTIKEQMDTAYRNMKPELRQASRRFEFSDYNGLMTLAKEVERTAVPEGEVRTAPKPDESLFPELAYRKKAKSLASGNSTHKSVKQTDNTNSQPASNQPQDQLTSLLSTLIKKLDQRGSFDNRAKQANNFVRSNSDPKRDQPSSDSQKHSVDSSRQVRPKINTPRMMQTPKSEPPCSNCNSKDHGWRNCPTT